MLPLILETLFKAPSIGLILSFNLSSDDAYAITSPPALIVFKIPKPPLTINAPVVLDVDCVVASILTAAAKFVALAASIVDALPSIVRYVSTPPEPLSD